MIRLKIDNKEIEVKKETTLLEAAKKLNIYIPTLCYHPAVQSYGSCRVCIVEITKQVWKSWSKLVVSCAYPVENDLIVYADSNKVIKSRKFILELLLSRCPDSQVIKELSAKYGVYETRFISDTGSQKEINNCILCGLCVRVCSEMIGKSAISFTSRGPDRKVRTPFNKQSDACIGCGACAYVCPTGVIKIEDIYDKRKLENWKTEIKLEKCRNCGNTYGTFLQLEIVKLKMPELSEEFNLCSVCRREKIRNNIVQPKMESRF